MAKTKWATEYRAPKDGERIKITKFPDVWNNFNKEYEANAYNGFTGIYEKGHIRGESNSLTFNDMKCFNYEILFN